MKYFDENPSIITWASEEFSIPYISKVDNNPHRYFPDFYISYYDKDKVLRKCVIEIKPSSELNQPVFNNKNVKRIERYYVNISKWEAAKLFCEERNIEFRILTEKEVEKAYKKILG